LALVEPVALRFPIKKWAALTGLLAAGAYTLLVGAPVPTLRSLLMTGLVLIAVMADRNPLSMRLVAFAAGVVLLTQPESLLGPSFQMSFGAVVALIAGFEAVSQRWRAWRTQAGWLGRLGLYLAGIALSSLLATLATTPFSVFHFQQIAFYGLLANMVAVPITSFWIMPCGLIAYLAMPFGLDKGPLVVMGWGVDAIVRIAEATAALPGAVLPLPAMPDWGLGLAVMGGLWLMLWSGRWRLFGLVGVVVGMASPMTAERPDILISGNGKLIAARGADGDLMLSSRQSARFQGEAWRRRDGRDPKTPASAWPAVGRSGDGRLACDALGCLYRAQGYTVALAHDAQALAEDCVASDLVIATVNARRCKAPRVVDRWRLRKEGATAVYLDRDGIRIETVRQARGERPWIKKGD
ncbi:MAG TPA: ComEC/Rec2 family competence protein, partial [Azospirillaceae bacterium]|nr:ComEC/Rec2 family competence protein [Azospirillaceae bacterium]